MATEQSPGLKRADPAGETKDLGLDWNPSSLAMIGFPVVAETLRRKAMYL